VYSSRYQPSTNQSTTSHSSISHSDTALDHDMGVGSPAKAASGKSHHHQHKEKENDIDASSSIDMSTVCASPKATTTATTPSTPNTVDKYLSSPLTSPSASGAAPFDSPKSFKPTSRAGVPKRATPVQAQRQFRKNPSALDFSTVCQRHPMTHCVTHVID
jgi:hypothetical protein